LHSTPSGTVLIVEYDDAVLDLFTQVLGTAGYAAIPCHDDEQAIELLQGSVPNLLVLNPGPAGLSQEFVQAIDNDPRLSDLPILICATSPRHLERSQWRHSREWGTVSKPFDLPTLLNEVDSLASRSPRAQERSDSSSYMSAN
jgi:DNA-binding response OmpR family regulator